MANLSGFNAGEVEPNVAYDAIPAGWYEAMIVESEMKATSAGTGSFLLLKLQIIGGPHDGRKVWDRLNLDNPNEIAVRIAKGALSSICRAVNVLTPADSTELHNLPLMVKVATKMYEGELQNEVKGYKAKGGDTQSAASSTASTPPGGAAASAPKKPAGPPAWMNKKAQ